MLLRIALVVSNVYMYVHVCWKRVLSYLSKLLQLLAHHFKIVKHIFYNTILQPYKADNDGILMLLFLCIINQDILYFSYYVKLYKKLGNIVHDRVLPFSSFLIIPTEDPDE